MTWEDFPSVLDEFKPVVYRKIGEYLPSGGEELDPEHWKAIKEYPDRQGKYFRPTLSLLTCQMLSNDWKRAVLTAAAVQTLEDWLLIHDDIEDKSENRRGKPTLHRIYGLNTALNAGDSLHAIMWKMLSDNDDILPRRTARRIRDKMYGVLMRTCEGQSYEESWIKYKKIDMTEEEYYKLVDRKTGGYTIIGPMQLGAIVADADDRTLSSIEKVGIPFGRAFQLRDDTLNIIASFEAYGKEAGGDILEGKRTLLLTHLLKNCTLPERRRIIGIYSKPREMKTEKEKNYVMDLMEKYGSVEYANSETDRYGKMAIKALEKGFPKVRNETAKQRLIDAIEFVCKRNK